MNIASEVMDKFYRRYAPYYDLFFGTIFHPGRHTAIEHLQCRKGERILEVGVGTGLSLGLYPDNVKVVGIDLSREMLDVARRKLATQTHPQLESLLQMDAQKMTFPDSSFDKVVAMYVATVVSSPKTLVDEMRRVCKPGGKIIFLNHFRNKNPLIGQFEAWAQPLARHVGFHPNFPLQKFLEDTKFEVSTAIPVNALDYWTILVGPNKKNIKAG